MCVFCKELKPYCIYKYIYFIQIQIYIQIDAHVYVVYEDTNLYNDMGMAHTHTQRHRHTHTQRDWEKHVILTIQTVWVSQGMDNFLAWDVWGQRVTGEYPSHTPAIMASISLNHPLTLASKTHTLHPAYPPPAPPPQTLKTPSSVAL